MAWEIEQFICREDNYGVVIHDPASGETMIVDAPEAAPIVAVLERRGWKPSTLLITHHHGDHVAGNLALKERYGLGVVGPEKEADKIPGIDRTVSEGDEIPFGGGAFRVLETPGHTAGHVTFFHAQEGVAFAADTLFALGCGRVLECPYEVMYESLARLAALPPETVVYVGHEYTLANALFAVTVDPENETLKARAKEVAALRERNAMTLPTTIARELETNPMLRWSDPGIRKVLGMEGASDADVFTEVRHRKDVFRA